WEGRLAENHLIQRHHFDELKEFADAIAKNGLWLKKPVTVTTSNEAWWYHDYEHDQYGFPPPPTTTNPNCDNITWSPSTIETEPFFPLPGIGIQQIDLIRDQFPGGDLI